MFEKIFHFFLIVSLMIPGKIRLDDSLPHYGGAEYVIVPFDLVFVFFCFYKLITFSGKGLKVKYDPYFLLFTIYISLNILILPFSLSLDYSIYEIIRLTKYFIWFIFLRDFITNWDNFKVIIYAFLAIVFTQLLFVIVQSSTGIGFSGWKSGEENQLNVIGDSIFRASGTFSHPGILSQFLVILLPFLYMACVSFNNDKKIRILSLIGFLSIYYIVVQSYARAGIIISMLISLVIFFLYVKESKSITKKISSLIVIAGISTLGLYIFVDDVVYRFTNASVESSDIRIWLNKAAFNMISDRPLYGVGLNSFTEVLNLYDKNSSVSYLKYPVHNVFLLIMAESGIIVGLFFVFINVCVLINIFLKSKYNYPFLSKGNFSFALFLSLIIISLFALQGWSWRLDSIQALYWLLIALASNIQFNRLR